MNIDKLKKIRHELHSIAELSGKEFNTVKYIENYVLNFSPSKVLTCLADTGIAFVFESTVKDCKTICLRADLDALPITETTDLTYKSENEGVSHKCGHDGHMTIILGLLDSIDLIKNKVRLVLLFQPAEEIGAGAKKVLQDKRFNDLNIDYIFGFHNVPGFDTGQILIKNNYFACSSVGMRIDVEGHTSHAAEPLLAKTPYPFVLRLMDIISTLNCYNLDDDFKIITMTHLCVGEKSFGITPGFAQIYLTLRAKSDELIQVLKNTIKESFSEFTDLKFNYSLFEDFPATVNTNKGYNILKRASKKFQVTEIERPFKWSEDFGHYTKYINGAYFGIGVGYESHDLHHKDFDFNDDIIKTGVDFYLEVINQVALD